jgi:hypothetical protein
VLIHDIYANQRSKGDAAAVDRLQAFALALDHVAERRRVPTIGCAQFFQQRPPPDALLDPVPSLGLGRPRRVPEHVRDPGAAARVPAHKRLSNAAAGCGLPVGNLTCRFFANVYLNPLGQFVKHMLKVRHCLRYEDDFVLLAETRAQLLQPRSAIEAFLQDSLRQRLKDQSRLQFCAQGVDFLGDIVLVHRWRARRRVGHHCGAKLDGWYQPCGAALRGHRLTSADFAQSHALLGSYWGHFAHADSVRLRRQMFERRPWMGALFTLAEGGSLTVANPAMWQVRRRRRVRHILKPEGDTP